MYVDRVLSPVVTLGPGQRVALWLSGCTKHCPGCANPELWEHTDAQWLTVGQLAQALLSIARERGVHRLTVTGGDPLEQADELAQLLQLVRPAYPDILVYTGYTLDEARRAIATDTWGQLVSCVDVLIDGPYLEARNDGLVALRGSTNQLIHYLSEHVRDEYETYLAQGRTVQNFVVGGRAISVGIHKREDARHGE